MAAFRLLLRYRAKASVSSMCSFLRFDIATALMAHVKACCCSSGRAFEHVKIVHAALLMCLSVAGPALIHELKTSNALRHNPTRCKVMVTDVIERDESMVVLIGRADDRGILRIA